MVGDFTTSYQPCPYCGIDCSCSYTSYTPPEPYKPSRKEDMKRRREFNPRKGKF